MANVSDIIEYYRNLLIIQYSNQPKAQATIRLLTETLLASGIMMDVRDGYNLNTAVGVQLDILGKYIGIDRYYTGQNLSGYFAFTNYTELTPAAGKEGFETQAAFPSGQGKWLTYDSILGIGLALDDDDYRTILRLKIIQNNSDHSRKSIDDAIYAFFGSTVFADSLGNMVMYYFVPNTLSEIIRVAIQKNVLPKPIGVRLNYYIPQIQAFFAFTTYGTLDSIPTGVTGYTDYADYGIKMGQTLDYDDLLTGA